MHLGSVLPKHSADPTLNAGFTAHMSRGVAGPDSVHLINLTSTLIVQSQAAAVSLAALAELSGEETGRRGAVLALACVSDAVPLLASFAKVCRCSDGVASSSSSLSSHPDRYILKLPYSLFWFWTRRRTLEWSKTRNRLPKMCGHFALVLWPMRNSGLRVAEMFYGNGCLPLSLP